MYYIYHIKGVKIGCTDDLERRISQQNFTNYEVLETHTDIYEASNRELKLQKKYGYPVDRIPYFKSVERWGSNAGKIGGKNSQKTLKKNKLGIYSITKSDLIKRYNQILQFDKSGKLIKKHNLIGDAALEMGVTVGAIYNCIYGRNKTCKGFVWKFDK